MPESQQQDTWTLRLVAVLGPVASELVTPTLRSSYL